jgi:hypothetical protein
VSGSIIPGGNGAPFKTIVAAWNLLAANYDMNNQQVTCQLATVGATRTVYDQIFWSGEFIGGGTILLQGDLTTYTNTEINAFAAAGNHGQSCFSIRAAQLTQFKLKNINFVGESFNGLISLFSPCTVTLLGHVGFGGSSMGGSSNVPIIWPQQNVVVYDQASAVTIDGTNNIFESYITSSSGSYSECNSTFTGTNSPTFKIGFLFPSDGATIFNFMTNAGGWGSGFYQHIVSSGSRVESLGYAPNHPAYFPGDKPGIVCGGNYV